MSVRSAQDLASRLVRDNAWIIRCSYLIDDDYDAFNNGVASAVQDAVKLAYEFDNRESREFIRTLIKEL